jgi:hypothetical protein
MAISIISYEKDAQNKIANGCVIEFEYNGCILTSAAISAHHFLFFEVKSCKSGYSQAKTTCYGIDCTVVSVSCK